MPIHVIWQKTWHLQPKVRGAVDALVNLAGSRPDIFNSMRHRLTCSVVRLGNVRNESGRSMVYRASALGPVATLQTAELVVGFRLEAACETFLATGSNRDKAEIQDIGFGGTKQTFD